MEWEQLLLSELHRAALFFSYAVRQKYHAEAARDSDIDSLWLECATQNISAHFQLADHTNQHTVLRFFPKYALAQHALESIRRKHSPTLYYLSD